MKYIDPLMPFYLYYFVEYLYTINIYQIGAAKKSTFRVQNSSKVLPPFIC